ncbi:MAG TPA: Lrp/AsnC family transcriptional regulator [Aromatoleum sp.]|uniref:Lrp/AsnC family transcriptional regulator n=1 Tax=Aromatoleum sp. TaxID=2307007 RepID=UPI002B459687|nr:Lrp/AsnC family transcriptional regulator [Aromatoleum sp.]HJV25864.1 Lrp/AsnC family transcriptional regulator [Aromatoleum sp.]
MASQTTKRAELDAFDRTILRILQADNKTPQRSIADQVNLSAASVQRRIAEMEKSGVIEKNVSVINPKAAGQAITVIVEVHLKSDQSSVVNPAKALFKSVPQIQQCYYVTGNGGLILVVLVEDMEAYEALARRLFADNESVLTYRSLVVLDRVKVGLSVDI